uniref:8.9 kDa family member n=1 Tax=Rhipicephalus appendiculatus TaxID=34631 RepID=A0A131YR48_RHIAP
MFIIALISPMLWAGISSEYSEYDCPLPNSTDVLKNGTVKNNEKPCVEYTCQWGNLWTQGCRVMNDELCKQMSGPVGPYPDCCPVYMCSHKHGK